MNILCITHADFETPGVIIEWAAQKNYNFVECKPYVTENCLEYDNFDMLVIMGGPQSANDASHVSYLSDEVELIKRAVNANKIVVGFCLGAQLIGVAMGSPAEKSPEKEIGVYPVLLVDDRENDPIVKDLSNQFDAIHWHNDMPGIPSNAKILAYSAGCPRQIIKYGDKVYGFQCHLEITRDGIKTMITECTDDLRPSTFTQSAEEMLLQDYDAINKIMNTILDRLSAL